MKCIAVSADKGSADGVGGRRRLRGQRERRLFGLRHVLDRLLAAPLAGLAIARQARTSSPALSGWPNS